MSWNNVIPWEVLECQSICDSGLGYAKTDHKEGCPIGKKLKEEQERQTQKSPH